MARDEARTSTPAFVAFCHRLLSSTCAMTAAMIQLLLLLSITVSNADLNAFPASSVVPMETSNLLPEAEKGTATASPRKLAKAVSSFPYQFGVEEQTRGLHVLVVALTLTICLQSLLIHSAFGVPKEDDRRNTLDP